MTDKQFIDVVCDGIKYKVVLNNNNVYYYLAKKDIFLNPYWYELCEWDVSSQVKNEIIMELMDRLYHKDEIK